MKGRAKFKFDTHEAMLAINEVGQAEWEFVDMSIVGTEAMFTFKREKKEISENEPLWK